ncbi:hypothetical protein PVK06_012347 [Gossypium arboreum]|uniref:Uncharacterized protein n=1 Tax=Gossypium arboreum TaxID=29729 RepID=A0ABR0QBN5_GOSAR|nr:hypothetical protein PVK06_012347 [Gossypium arboreum]
MLIYFHEPGTVGLQNNLRVIYDDTSTIAMLDFWVKFKEINLYVEHEVDNPIMVDENFPLTTREGDDKGVESDGEDEYIGMESGGNISLGSTVGEDNDNEVAADEYVGDFATSDGVDNVAATSSEEEEDGNETDV